MSGPTAKTRDMVVERAQGRCERCLAPGAQVHHRQPRKAGGSKRAHINAPSNLALLCVDCHATVESRRAYACAAGWLVREPQSPASVPMLTGLAGWVFLDDDGNYLSVEAA